MGTFVSLTHRISHEDIEKTIERALQLINFEITNKVESIIIKPNLCYYWNASTGYTTDPYVVEGIIDLVREKCGTNVDIKVAEADASAMRTKHAFLMLGYEKLAEKKKITLFNLSSDSILNKKVKVGKREISFKIPSSLLNCDLFINVPKLKIMRSVKVTCALKNIFGCIAMPRKIAYHPFLEDAIVGINKVLHPNLTIVDGLVALGQYPAKLDMVMASADPFSVDWVASQIMGYNPKRIGFLKVAMKENVGNPSGIVTRGESVAEFRKIFPIEPLFSVNRFWSPLLKLFKLYTTISGDVVHPSLEGV
jgi:uncharacterized protein (DUF362 family)